MKAPSHFSFAGAGLVLGLLFVATPAIAQNATPALSGIGEIQVQPARMGNKAASDACGMSSGEIAAEVLKLLRADGLPVYSVMETPPQKSGVTRIDLQPEVVTLSQQNVDCVSWVSLFAQSRASVTIPPVQVPRNITATYWRGGLMISSTQISHPRALKDALEKLTGQFSRQYRLDQPPVLPDLGK